MHPIFILILNLALQILVKMLYGSKTVLNLAEFFLAQINSNLTVLPKLSYSQINDNCLQIRNSFAVLELDESSLNLSLNACHSSFEREKTVNEFPLGL